MNPLHDYLRVAGGTTAPAMWDELCRLRRLGVPSEGLPYTFEQFEAGLRKLGVAGLACEDRQWWYWLPVKAKEEKRLF